MFNNISWQGYWTTIAFITTGYYLVIYLFYFKKDFLIRLNGNPKSMDHPSALFSSGNESFPDAAFEKLSSIGSSDSSIQRQDTSEDTIVFACIDEINAYLEQAKKSKCVKEELLYAFQAILRKYPLTATPAYKGTVANIIVNQCEYLCSVHLSADDMETVWVEG